MSGECSHYRLLNSVGGKHIIHGHAVIKEPPAADALLKSSVGVSSSTEREREGDGEEDRGCIGAGREERATTIRNIARSAHLA